MRNRLLLIAALLFTAAVGIAARDLDLVNAVRSHDTAAVRALLQQGVDVNARQPDGATALHWAAYREDVETAGLLIRAGAAVNAANQLGVTPLYLACENGNALLVETLLKAGADPNAQLPSGETALMTAARSGTTSAVRTLLAHGADAQVREKTDGQTALMWAVAQRHPDVAQVLMAAGSDVKARSNVRRELTSLGWVDEGGYTPLLFAARNGDLASARLLLAAGADVNDTAPLGTSALVVASHSGHGALAEFLLSEGADPNASGAGYSALHTAILRGDVHLVEALLARGVDPNARLRNGSKSGRQAKLWEVPAAFVGTTPFFLAAKFAEAGIMRALAGAGADTASGLESSRTTPLMVAAGLLTSGFARGSIDRRGRQVDHAEVELLRLQNPDERKVFNSGIEAVKVAIEWGADVNAVNQAGNTAMHGAALHGFVSVIEFLAAKGATLDIRNKQGQTPMMVGSESPDGDGKVSVELLRRLGAKE